MEPETSRKLDTMNFTSSSNFEYGADGSFALGCEAVGYPNDGNASKSWDIAIDGLKTLRVLGGTLTLAPWNKLHCAGLCRVYLCGDVSQSPRQEGSMILNMVLNADGAPFTVAIPPFVVSVPPPDPSGKAYSIKVEFGVAGSDPQMDMELELCGRWSTI